MRLAVEQSPHVHAIFVFGAVLLSFFPCACAPAQDALRKAGFVVISEASKVLSDSEANVLFPNMVEDVKYMTRCVSFPLDGLFQLACAALHSPHACCCAGGCR